MEKRPLAILPFNPSELPFTSVSHSDKLTCSVEQIKLTSASEVEFEALSYVWGQSEPHSIIECDGNALRITSNLRQALLHLRSTGHRTLWIDAICINQRDTLERSSQVSLMGKIFQAAKNVVVWLGEEASGDQTLNITPYDIGRGVEEEIIYGKPLLYLTRPWFSRAWALQEAMLARRMTILLDDEEVQWDKFWARISSELRHTLGTARDPPAITKPALRFYALASTSKLIKFMYDDPIASWAVEDLDLSKTANAEFKRILEFSRTLNVTDPRDRIYTLLWVFQTMGINVPPPDYTKHTETVFQELYTAVGDVPFPWRPMRGWEKHVDNTALRSTGAKWRVKTTGNGEYNPTLKSLHHGDLLVFLEAKTRITGEAQIDNAKALPIHSVSNIPTREESMESPTTTNDKNARENIHAPPEKPRGYDEDTRMPEGLHLFAHQEPRNVEENKTIYHSFFDDILRYEKELLMTRVLHYLGCPWSYDMVVNGNGDTDAPETTSNSSSDTKSSSTNWLSKETKLDNPKKRSGPRRKRDRNDEDDEDDKDGDEAPSKKRPASDPRDRLACPYFQRNIKDHRFTRACRGPGFIDIAKLKSHRIFPCNRCGTVFKERDSLRAHQQQHQGCSASDLGVTFDRAEGFDDQQYDELHAKTVRSWCHVFKIPFPDDPRNSYPPEHYRNIQVHEIIEDVRSHFSRESERLMPRYATPAFRFSLEDMTQDEFCASLHQLVHTIFDEGLRSYRVDPPTEVTTSAAAGPEEGHNAAAYADTPTPWNIFGDYLLQVTPDGVASTMQQVPDTGLGSGWMGNAFNLGPQTSDDEQMRQAAGRADDPMAEVRPQAQVPPGAGAWIGRSQTLVNSLGHGPWHVVHGGNNVEDENSNIDDLWDLGER
ncbi:heterokaryon incompatibility protein [Seiridium cupressi]